MVGQNVKSYKKPKSDNMSEIYSKVKSMCLYAEDKKISYEDALNKVLMKGYSQ